MADRAFLYYRQDNEKSSVNNLCKINCVIDEYGEIDPYLKNMTYLL